MPKHIFMKIFISSKPVFVFLFVLLFAYACSPSANEESLPPGKMRLDLSPYGKSFSMVIPDSASNDFSITENNAQLEIRCVNKKVNLNFAVVVEEGEGNVNLIKSDIQSDDINRFVRFLSEDSSMIVWESAITTPEFHFYAVIRSENSAYVIRDLISTDNEPFTEKQILEMVSALKGVRFFSEAELREKNLTGK